MPPKKAKMGRPTIEDEPLLTPVMLRLTREIVEAVDEFRLARLEKPKRSVMIRELLGEAIEARRKSR